MTTDIIKRLRERIDFERDGGMTVRWVKRDELATLLDRLDAAERERDSKAAELANLQVAFSDWKVFHSTARLEAENDRLRIEIGGLRSQLLGFRVETGEGSFTQNLSAAIHASEAIDAARKEK